MLSLSEIIHAGDYMTGVRLHHRTIPAIPAFIRPPDLATAYRIQDVLVKRLLTRQGGAQIGYKIACTNDLAQNLLNVEAPLFGQLLSFSSYSSPARLDANQLRVWVIESEFTFRMKENVPASPEPYVAESMGAYVDALLPSIEIVTHHFEDWAAVGAPSIAADNAIHGAWIGGEAFTAWETLDLLNHNVSLIVNDGLLAQGTGAAVLGHPLHALAWLANELPKHGRQLLQGELITTGVCMNVYEAQAGDHLAADFGELGTVELWLD
ncbi:MAG: fumarylacetoacetate hydrolase family protein [Chloroflexota bacterium]